MNFLKIVPIVFLIFLKQSCTQADLQPFKIKGEDHYNQGNQYLEERSYINAINAFQAAIQENDNEAVFFLNLGFAQQKLLLYTITPSPLTYGQLN